uniref:NADH-ubiquinone oxidoreductase chain 5 n=1 Tax=Liphistius erawan TaxID=1155480 RepID=L7NWH4_LIPER|nr:NADH dehydrogenase subunit 5 [Liphistius erawan]AFC77876.1 NADH dehydrogenase subunit 5 [Liphistius erawan]
MLFFYGLGMVFMSGVFGVIKSYLFMGGKVFWVDYLIFSFSSIDMSIELMLDWISLSFLSCIMLISGCVFMFSVEYMEGEMEDKFCLLVFLFVVSMCLVIISGNVVFILLGWDGLGLVSFILVIYYQNMKSLNAGLLTIFSNRVGDVALLMVIGLMVEYGDWMFNSFCEMGWLISTLLIIAAMTKSAQMPFSAWLPAAMAAPTPVSALVHSSTLVTAGVYLLIRVNMEGSMMVMLFILSAVTMFMSGLSANWETDFKKVVALSTLSQIGVMMFSISLGCFVITYFHLLIHALFKSMMFLCVGVVIHTKVSQDFRLYGGCLASFPMVNVGLGVSGMALMGLPFMSGYYSKDVILEKFLEGGIMMMVVILVLFSFGLIAGYMFRLIKVGVSFSSNGIVSLFFLKGSIMEKSIYVLALLSVVAGALVSWLIPIYSLIILGWEESTMGLMFIFLGIWGSFHLNFFSSFMKEMNLFMSSLWFLQMMSCDLLAGKVKAGDKMFNFDLSWGEVLGPHGISNFFKDMSSGIETFRSMTLWVFFISIFLWVLVILLL